MIGKCVKFYNLMLALSITITDSMEMSVNIFIYLFLFNDRLQNKTVKAFVKR